MVLVDYPVLNNQDKGGDFRINENGVMRFRDWAYVPDVPELKKSILEEDHINRLSIHPGATKMYKDLKKLFWWPGMKKEVAEFVYACLTCKKSKIEHQKSLGLMQLLIISEWMWDNISMDFITNLPKTMNECDFILVIVDKLTKSAHFILIRINYTLQKLVELYIENIVSLYGISLSIVSNRDLRFTLRFWKRLQEGLGTKLKLSSADHP